MNFTRAYWSKTYLKPSNLRSYTILFLMQLLISFSSCKKTEDFYLEGNAPEAPFDLQIDTFDLSLQTETYTSRTNKLGNDLLGTYVDPVFGRSTANVYTRLALSQFNPSFTTASVCDSVMLYIRLDKNTFSGNLQDVQNWKIYELEEAPQTGISYFSDAKFATKGAAIGTFSKNLNPADSLLRIEISKDFGRRFFTQDKNVFSSNASFINFLQGIAILPDSNGVSKGKGAVVLTELTNAASRLVLFYDTSKSLSMRFDNDLRVNTYSQNLNNTEAGNALNHFSGKAYMQSIAGLRVHATIPGFDTFTRSKNIAVHKAELIFTKLDSAGDPENSKQPGKVLLNVRAGDGGNTNSSVAADWSEKDKSYHILISRYMQFLANNNRSNKDFVDYGYNLIVTPDAPVSPNRAIINAGKSENKPKLIITYTKLAE
ncbi:MAG: DUF4270 family protein [Chitinophagaceae bacterium]|nr:MAG: DUF4270 family protein [Chitinophagaceae bacterium]